MTLLTEPLRLRKVKFGNRIWVSPMCQYSAKDGVVNDWHLMHYGSLATGHPGLIIAESTAISAAGRISPLCAGIWTSDQMEAWRRVVSFVRNQDVPIGLQLAHSGRKGSSSPPWDGEEWIAPADGGWETVGPSTVAYGDYASPRAMTIQDMENMKSDFVEAAMRADTAGFDVIEIHAAHGYLLHSFLSPLSNHRTDRYGGSIHNRMRFPSQVIADVRSVWPDDKPLFVRISCTDWHRRGWQLEDSVLFAECCRDLGVDLVDCSSGGLIPAPEVPRSSTYQIELAGHIRRSASVATGAVGRIRDSVVAAQAIDSGAADAVLMGRKLLSDPRWPLVATESLGKGIPWPVQYERASRAALGSEDLGAQPEDERHDAEVRGGLSFRWVD